MMMLLNQQNALTNHTSANSFSLSSPSTHPTLELRRHLPPPVCVSSSLALSRSLLQALGPIQSAPCTPRCRPCDDIAHSEVRYNPLFKNEDRAQGWKTFSNATSSGGHIEERSEEKMPPPTPTPTPDNEPYFTRLRPTGTTTPQGNSPKGDGAVETASSIEIIERRAKASIEKLRHILYTVKTRSPDKSVSSAGFHRFEEGPRRVYKEPAIQASPSRPYEDAFNEEKRTEDPPKQERERESPAVKSEHEAYAHHDAVTCTKSTVKFNKETNTAVVTLVATVRGDASVHDGHMNQRSVILAARALARVCSALEEKASTAISAVEKRPIENATLNATIATEKEIEHNCILEQLKNGEFMEAFEIKKGHGATPFRPVYVVKLGHKDGSVSHALFKPFILGDAHRYSTASPEWVSYQIGQLLETDMVPPAVMRRDVKVGGKLFALGTLILYVPDVRTLTRLGPQEWGAESSVYFVSNAHILDALVGTAPRERRFFMEGLHWVRHGKRRPMLLDHPMGPANGKLHPMWSPKGNFKGVRKVSNQTLASLKGLDLPLLQEKLGTHVSVEEIERILKRRDEVVAYFESISKTGPALVV